MMAEPLGWTCDNCGKATNELCKFNSARLCDACHDKEAEHFMTKLLEEFMGESSF